MLNQQQKCSSGPAAFKDLNISDAKSFSDECSQQNRYLSIATNSPYLDQAQPLNNGLLLAGDDDWLGWQLAEDMANSGVFDVRTVAAFPVTLMDGLFMSLQTPEGLALMAEILLVNKLQTLAIEGLGRSIAKVMGKELASKALEKAIAKGGKKVLSKACVNMGTAVKIAAKGTEVATAAEIELIVAAVCPPCGLIELMLDLIMVIGMIIDLVDPFGCGARGAVVDQLNADTLASYVEGYNKAFMDSYLSSLMTRITTPDGSVTGQTNYWPLEYTANYLYNTLSLQPSHDTIASVLGTYPSDEDAAEISWEWIESYYSNLYLQQLRFNAFGLPLYVGDDEDNDKLLSMDDIPAWNDVLAMKITHQNTKAASHIERWWPIYLIFFSGVIIFILFMIK